MYIVGDILGKVNRLQITASCAIYTYMNTDPLKEARRLIAQANGQKSGKLWSEKWKNMTEEQRQEHIQRMVIARKKKRELENA
jgi:hypothetical protein